MNLTALILLTLIAAREPGEAIDRNAPVTVENVVAEMNRWRAFYDLEPLENDHRLNLAAQDRIIDMEERSYWAHQHPTEGGSPFVWIRGRGYVYRAAGENLAAGYETTVGLVASWMTSPGHRANILHPEFEDVGIAWIEGGTTHRMTGRSIVVLFAKER